MKYDDRLILKILIDSGYLLLSSVINIKKSLKKIIMIFFFKAVKDKFF